MNAPHGLTFSVFKNDEMALKLYFRLKINIEGCVNTLSMECMNFYNIFGKDGRNHTARAVYECYYDPFDPDFVVIDFNPKQTLMQLVFFSVIPGNGHSNALFSVFNFFFCCERVFD